MAARSARASCSSRRNESHDREQRRRGDHDPQNHAEEQRPRADRGDRLARKARADQATPRRHSLDHLLRFMPKPSPTTDACNRSLVGFEVLPANGWPMVGASASPSASAIGGDAHGVARKISSAKKRKALSGRSPGTSRVCASRRPAPPAGCRPLCACR